jgi:WD40 repeat protein
MYMHSASGRHDGWTRWLRCITLIVQCLAASGAAGVAAVAYAAQDTQAAPAAQGSQTPQDNGAPRSLSFQVHDTERRLALVLGNAAYVNGPLSNPSNDGAAMAGKLRQLGFEVIEKENATREDMVRLSREFGNRLKLGGVGVFYFAGHGVQMNGNNYLLPVDADIQDETELESRAYDVNEMLSKMDAAKNRLNIIILDACRNNPIKRTTRSIQYGLAAMQQGTGTIVAYATQPGATAADGPVGGNSLYTQQLLLALSQPGLRVEDVFKQVRREVYSRSNGSQTPWENSSLIGEFYFNRGAGGEAAAPAEATRAAGSMPAGPPVLREATAAPQLEPNPVLVPRTLLDTYGLASNLPMPAPVTLAQFSADSSRFALVTQDRQLRVWDVVTSNTLISQDGFDAPAVSADGRYLTGIADDHSVNVLDLTATTLAVRTFHSLDALRAVVATKPQRLVVVGRTGAVTLYDFDSGRPVGPSPGKITAEPHFEFSPAGGRALLWGGADSDMLLVDLTTGKRVSRVAEHGSTPLQVRFSRDGNLLLVSLEGGNAEIFRMSDGGSQAKLALGSNTATLSKAEFLNDGKEVLGYFAQTDPKLGVLHRLAIWDTAKGKLVATVAEGAAVTDLRYSPDSKVIYFSMSDNTINVFELNTKAKRRVLTDATLAGFSADGQRVLAVEGDAMRLYEARTFSPIARMPGQTSAFLQANAGGVFATAASDGTVSLWEFERGDPVAQLKGHIDAVQQVVFGPGGKHLASFGKGRTAKLWGLPEVKDLEKLKRDQFESSSDYTRRVAEWSSPYTALVGLGEYNADAETFTVRIGDVALTLPVARADAKRFAGQREGILTAQLKVFDVDHLQLKEAKLSRVP